ncbi:ATP-grasp domain-containing protein [Patescibacteria group bacterium]|nr:ATP-grasp domain-containing protein [Patescibacteria group bacterium]MBU1896023.1 ATP-grasp domain-containing protein [Patescibacteria group bacterium]
MKKKNIILFINVASAGSVSSLKKYSRKIGQKFRVAVIRDNKNKNGQKQAGDLGVDILFACNLDNPLEIEKELLPYRKEFLAVTCRGEANMNIFSKVIPHVPYLKTPTTASVLWSTDKTYMRKMFRAYDKSITPKFTIVSNTKKETIKKIKDKVGFPLIMKPAGLASSLLVTVCYHKEELVNNLRTAFSKIRKIYTDNSRDTVPKILVEQMMEGEMYSVDAYVNSLGKIYFCPFVHFTSGRSMGFDDFFCYKRNTPTTLKKESIKAGELVAEKAIHALGLRSSTAHVELIKTDDGWKIIELGPRIGGFRVEMYQLSYNIDHSLNDILIRMGKKPIISKKINGYTCALKFYAKKEGRLISLKGINKIQTLKSFKDIKKYKKVGEQCKFAMHGGKGVCDVVLFNKKRPELLADIRRAEKMVEIKTKRGK